jgi:type I restriction enzyme M protein
MGEAGDLTMTRLDRKDASPATQAALEAARTTLPPEDGEDFRLARRGFIATIPDADIPGAWSLKPYAFLEDETPAATVHPGLWRQARLNGIHGLFEVTIDGKSCVVEYESDSDLRDTEQIPLLEDGGIEAFIRREVLPYTPDAWVKEGASKIGYEVSFTRHFYKPQPLRTLEEIRADIIAAEQEAEGVLGELLKGGKA